MFTLNERARLAERALAVPALEEAPLGRLTTYEGGNPSFLKLASEACRASDLFIWATERSEGALDWPAGLPSSSDRASARERPRLRRQRL